MTSEKCKGSKTINIQENKSKIKKLCYKSHKIVLTKGLAASIVLGYPIPDRMAMAWTSSKTKISPLPYDQVFSIALENLVH